jgi:acylphosphatase
MVPGGSVSEDEGIEFEVFGRVQGVGYRAFTAREAAELDIRGWVKNRSDGAVEGVAVGRSVDLDKFVERLCLGSRLSAVLEVRRRPTEAVKWSGFLVRR